MYKDQQVFATGIATFTNFGQLTVRKCVLLTIVVVTRLKVGLVRELWRRS